MSIAVHTFARLQADQALAFAEAERAKSNRVETKRMGDGQIRVTVNTEPLRALPREDARAAFESLFEPRGVRS